MLISRNIFQKWVISTLCKLCCFHDFFLKTFVKWIDCPVSTSRLICRLDKIFCNWSYVLVAFLSLVNLFDLTIFFVKLTFMLFISLLFLSFSGKAPRNLLVGCFLFQSRYLCNNVSAATFRVSLRTTPRFKCSTPQKSLNILVCFFTWKEPRSLIFVESRRLTRLLSKQSSLVNRILMWK